MAEIQHAEFGQRLNQIVNKHRKLSRGYVAKMNSDGLIVARPVRKNSHNTARALIVCLAVLFSFKVFLHQQIGAEAYGARVEILQNGTIAERIGAFAMVADPITVWLAGHVSNVK